MHFTWGAIQMSYLYLSLFLVDGDTLLRQLAISTLHRFSTDRERAKYLYSVKMLFDTALSNSQVCTRQCLMMFQVHFGGCVWAPWCCLLSEPRHHPAVCRHCMSSHYVVHTLWTIKRWQYIYDHNSWKSRSIFIIFAKFIEIFQSYNHKCTATFLWFTMYILLSWKNILSAYKLNYIANLIALYFGRFVLHCLETL